MRILKYITVFCFCAAIHPLFAQDINLDNWDLIWEDDFNYDNADLDKNWFSENASPGHILSSRWRENAVVTDEVLHLVSKVESRGGKEYTSGNVWTKKKFKYGYFESRFKYTEASGVNNAFWFITSGAVSEGKRFELDVNEGKYSNSIDTNIHNWETEDQLPDGSRPNRQIPIYVGSEVGYSIELEQAITTKKVRLVSNNHKQIHIGEFRCYNVSANGYPTEVVSDGADASVSGLINYTRQSGTNITCSGYHPTNWKNVTRVANGQVKQTWLSQIEGEKWLEIEFDSEKTLGCIQFTNGYWYTKNEVWKDLMSNYTIQYWDGTAYIDIKSHTTPNLSDDYHTYGCEWNEDEIIFYFDRKEIRREPNNFCYNEAPIYLSTAVANNWAGPIDNEQLDGSSMKIDYVRQYWPKGTDKPIENIIDINFHSFEGATSGSNSWTIQSKDALEVVDDFSYHGNKSLHFYTNQALTSNKSMYAPQGSLNFPAGDYYFSFWIYKEEGSNVDNVRIILDNPWQAFNVPVGNVAPGEWTLVSVPFTRSADSGATDRMRIQLQSSGVSGSADIYIDQIQITKEEIPTSIGKKINSESELSIYPNPAVDYIGVSCKYGETISIYNGSGILMSKQIITSEPQSVNIQSFPKGIYLIKVNTHSGIYLKKFIKK